MTQPSAPRLVQQRPWYDVLSCLCDTAYKRTLAANRKVPHVAAVSFLSCCLNGPLPYVSRHITVNKMC